MAVCTLVFTDTPDGGIQVVGRPSFAEIAAKITGRGAASLTPAEVYLNQAMTFLHQYSKQAEKDGRLTAKLPRLRGGMGRE